MIFDCRKKISYDIKRTFNSCCNVYQVGHLRMRGEFDSWLHVGVTYHLLHWCNLYCSCCRLIYSSQLAVMWRCGVQLTVAMIIATICDGCMQVTASKIYQLLSTYWILHILPTWHWTTAYHKSRSQGCATTCIFVTQYCILWHWPSHTNTYFASLYAYIPLQTYRNTQCLHDVRTNHTFWSKKKSDWMKMHSCLLNSGQRKFAATQCGTHVSLGATLLICEWFFFFIAAYWANYSCRPI